MKIVVIGLDSASWNLLMPWITDGSLPVFNRLLNGGIYGYLRSSNPPVTFPAWKCYSTGKKPDKLGVYSFVGFDREEKKVKFHTGFDFKDKEIWDYIAEKGPETCVINMPGTYPSKRTGIMVSGGPILGHDYFYPEEIKKYLKQINYKIEPDIYPGTKNNVHEHEHLKNLISSRFKLARILKKNFDIDFYHITIFYIDKIQHSYFNNKAILRNYWQLIDKEIGNFLEEFDDTNLFIISDHGATELKNTFYLNEYLLKKGYLSIKDTNKGLSKSVSRNHMYSYLIRKSQKYPFLFSNFKKIIPFMLKKRIKTVIKEHRKNDLINKIDWDNSNCIDIGMGFGLIYRLNDDCDLQKLKEELEEIIDPITGQQLCEVIPNNKVLKENSKDAPDLIIIPNFNTLITEVVRDNPEIWGDPPNNWKGIHEKEGIFLAHGPDIKAGEKIRNVKICDLAPTILHMFEIPVPDDMDGRVIKEIFNDKSEFSNRNIVYFETNEKVKLKKSIKKLKKVNSQKLKI